ELSTPDKIYILKLNKSGAPSSVKLNGVELTRVSSLAELELAEAAWYFDPMSVVYAKFKGLGGRCKLVLEV
ncbi:unnamed protein product, partial [marine sediment metagenome]